MPGTDLTVYLLTFGPGGHPFYKFGHNAIWIHDAAFGTDYVYNYGTFTFSEPALIPKFLVGRFQYWLSRRGIRRTLRVYRAENRYVEAQKLNLSPNARHRLQVFLENNLKPENRYYRYDYYLDNCSTRVRDALEQVLDGRLRAAATADAAMTYRQHTLRLTADLWWEYLALDVIMGDFIDQPIDRWAETFIPMELQQVVRSMRVPGPSGSEPLVLEERTLVRSTRPPVLRAPPSRGGWLLAFGILFGAVLAAMGYGGQRWRGVRVAASILLAGVGLFFGFLGCSFLFLWFLTDHVVAYANENLLQCAPWVIGLPFLAVGLAKARPVAVRRFQRLVFSAAAASLLGFCAKPLPWLEQDNWRIIALMMPLWAGAALATRWLGAVKPSE